MTPTRADLLAQVHPLTRALRRIEGEAAGRHGLSMWQYAVLSVASDSPGLSQRQVAEVLQYSVNRIVADVDELERRGLIRRKPGADRRANLLQITPAGRALRRRVQAVIHAGEDELLGHLSATARRDLARILGEVAERLRTQ